MIKKYVLFLCLAASFSFAYPAFSSTDMSDKRVRFVNPKSLPEKSLEFLDKYFNSYPIAHVRFNGSYVVMLKGNVSIKFDSKGKLESVYRNGNIIPLTSFIDDNILTYIKRKYNDASITYMGIKKGVYEIRLDNKKKLFFDNDFNFLEERETKY